MVYSKNNVENMMISINSNDRIIKDLMEDIRYAGKEIDTRMSDFARENKRLDMRQIKAYRDYVEEYGNFKAAINDVSTELHMHQGFYAGNIGAVACVLKLIHSRQLSIIDILCSLVSKTQAALTAFR